MTKRKTVQQRKKRPLLSHHRHTGKRLSRHTVSHLPLLLFLVFAGTLGISLVQQGNVRAADTIVVNAKVAAPLPPSAAEITTPTTETTVQEIPITIQGTCPAEYLLKIYRNNFFSGATICDNAGTFSLQSDLFVGRNELTAHVYNITDDEGPQSATVVVYYAPPTPISPEPSTPAETPTAPSKPGVSTVPQFILKSENTYRGYQIGQEVTWSFEALGGTAPYAFNIDWGDSTSTVVSRRESGKFSVNHTYKGPGGFAGSYTIRIKGTDNSGQAVYAQLVILINPPERITAGLLGTGGSGSAPQARTLTGIWVTYALSLLVVCTFYLGERWEYRHLSPQLKPVAKRHRPAKA